MLFVNTQIPLHTFPRNFLVG